tara:strand:- start:139 stop:321 length:183 start_codon:yes stop_codon:yes gene_type:complete
MSNMTRHELEQEVKWLQIVIKELEVEKDILWEYISDKDLNEIIKRLEEHENNMGKTQTGV